MARSSRRPCWKKRQKAKRSLLRLSLIVNELPLPLTDAGAEAKYGEAPHGESASEKQTRSGTEEAQESVIVAAAMAFLNACISVGAAVLFGIIITGFILLLVHSFAEALRLTRQRID
jgi:hypothetical protein